VTTNSPVSLTGDVTATSSFQLASGSTLSGNLTAPTATLDPSSSPSPATSRHQLADHRQRQHRQRHRQGGS
jgi:hypothetical protein